MRSVPLVKKVHSVEDIKRLGKYIIASGQECQCRAGCLVGFDGPLNADRRNVRLPRLVLFFSVRVEVPALCMCLKSHTGAGSGRCVRRRLLCVFVAVELLFSSTFVGLADAGTNEEGAQGGRQARTEPAFGRLQLVPHGGLKGRLQGGVSIAARHGGRRDEEAEASDQGGARRGDCEP